MASRAALLAASLAVLLACTVFAVTEEPEVQGLQAKAVHDLEDDLMAMLKSNEERRAMQMQVPKDLSLGESDENEDEASDETHEEADPVSLDSKSVRMQDSTDDVFPSDSEEDVSGDKARAEQRLMEEDAHFTKLNPKVRVVSDVGESTDDCIDDPAWANDCAHLTAHCGTSVVMKARCRKTCGCGPKLDIYIPSLKGAPGAHPFNGTRLS